MTQRYEWTPASEPPDSNRVVIVWCKTTKRPCTAWHAAWHGWHTMTDTFDVWRDVAPPNSSATLTGSGEQ